MSDLFDHLRKALHTIALKGKQVILIEYPRDFADVLLERFLPMAGSSAHVEIPENITILGVPLRFTHIGAVAFIVHTNTGREVYPINGDESLGSATLRVRLASEDANAMLSGIFKRGKNQ